VIETETLLDDFETQESFAERHRTCWRTVARYRHQGLPWLKWNGRIYIGPRDEARAWLLRRVRRTEGGAGA